MGPGMQGESVHRVAELPLGERHLLAVAKATANAAYILTGAWAEGDPPGYGACGGLSEGVMLGEK